MASKGSSNLFPRAETEGVRPDCLLAREGIELKRGALEQGTNYAETEIQSPMMQMIKGVTPP